MYGYNTYSCEEYTKKCREGWPGRFKEGVEKFWLPSVYSAVFVLIRDGGKLIIEYQEVVGWQFDWELRKESLQQYALERGVVVAQFASFLSASKV
jgi:hypothetical protein